MTNLLALISALAMIESGNNPKAVNGDCVGCLQLRPVFVKDCNRIAGANKWRMADRMNPRQSRVMALLWLDHYARPGMTVRDLALVFKVGPTRWREKTGLNSWTAEERDYADRVEAVYRENTK